VKRAKDRTRCSGGQKRPLRASDRGNRWGGSTPTGGPAPLKGLGSNSANEGSARGLMAARASVTRDQRAGQRKH